jgi:hypothetical protein
MHFSKPRKYLTQNKGGVLFAIVVFRRDAIKQLTARAKFEDQISEEKDDMIE